MKSWPPFPGCQKINVNHQWLFLEPLQCPQEKQDEWWVWGA